MPEPIESTNYTLQSVALKGAPTKEAAPGFEGVDSNTTVANVGEIREKAPDVLKNMFEQTFRAINKQLTKSQKRIKEMNRESRKYT